MLQKLRDLYDNDSLPNLLLYGNNLVGKKTLLEQLLIYIYKTNENIENNTLILNCSLGKGNIKFIRENLRFFANTITHKNITNFKSIILLNADSLTLDAQSALRRSIEIYNHTKFFIVTANKSKIIKPILSRFSEIYCNDRNMDIINKSLKSNNNNSNNNNSNSNSNSNSNKINNKLSLLIKNLDSKLETLNNENANENANENVNDYNKNVLLLEYSSLIYNKGISANNLLDYFTAKSNFKTDYYKFLFFFNIYKREIRVEEYLIYIILYFYSNPVNIDFSMLNNN
jgi:DNA polymerase III delta prime subunit